MHLIDDFCTWISSLSCRTAVVENLWVVTEFTRNEHVKARKTLKTGFQGQMRYESAMIIIHFAVLNDIINIAVSGNMRRTFDEIFPAKMLV